ncbi:MAG: TIGR04076 family protein [Trueperaceae bacterium]|nr:TIGR04076 family protein [Trueperaceae bacterium]
MTGGDGTFRLYDLRVEIVEVAPGLEDVCNHHLGDHFTVSGENVAIPAGRTFSLYALAAVLPLLPAKQRVTDADDWMSSDDLVMCPDPQCRAVMRITRTGVRTFRRVDVTATPPPDAAP